MADKLEHMKNDDVTFEVIEVQLPREKAELSGCLSESDGLINTQQVVDPNSQIKKHKKVYNSQILNLIRKQELAQGYAVGHLERRLRILENEKFRSEPMKKTPISGIHDCQSNPWQSPCEMGSIGHYNCIYVSPIYEDKRGNIMYRTQIVEDVRNRVLRERMRDGEKELEIRRLKAELQRHRLQDLQERNTMADKFIDKMNTISMPIMSRSRSCLERERFKSGQNTRITSCEDSAETLEESLNRCDDSQNLDGPYCETLMRKFFPRGLMNIMNETLLAGDRESQEEHSAIPDIDRSVLSSDSSKSNNDVQQTVISYLATMQNSVENLCNNFKICDPRDSDSSKINSGAIEDELFILKKTLCKIAEVCQESGYQSISCKGVGESFDVEKPGHGGIDGIMQQLAQSEFKVIALEASHIEKDRMVEGLTSRIQAILRETEAVLMDKFELTTTVQELHKEVEEQRHQIEELFCINEELLEFSQTKEDQLRKFQESKDCLMQQLVQCQGTLTALEALLQEKEKEMAELHRRLQALQIGTDAIIIEKIELKTKIQAMQQEAEEQERRIEELVCINEELLDFAQTKEDQAVATLSWTSLDIAESYIEQLASLNNEFEWLQGKAGQALEQNKRLMPNFEEKCTRKLK